MVRVVVRDRFLVGALRAEARDVGARHEGLLARAGQHHAAQRVVLGELLHDAAGLGPHVERHRVVARRIVEHHVADAALLAREHLVGLGHLVHVSLAFCSRDYVQSIFSARSFPISSLLKPNSARISSVCSPSIGGGATISLGVRESRTGWPTRRMVFWLLRAHVLGEAEVLHLRVREGLVDRVDRPARHAGLVEGVDPVGAGVLDGFLFHQRVDGIAVLRARRAGRVVRMLADIRRECRASRTPSPTSCCPAAAMLM